MELPARHLVGLGNADHFHHARQERHFVAEVRRDGAEDSDHDALDALEHLGESPGRFSMRDSTTASCSGVLSLDITTIIFSSPSRFGIHP